MTSRTDHVIDCRSDTVTQPCDDMKAEMMKATFGFDGYNESQDTTGKCFKLSIPAQVDVSFEHFFVELEEYMAQLLDKEAALFVPTATMGNLISSKIIICP